MICNPAGTWSLYEKSAWAEISADANTNGIAERRIPLLGWICNPDIMSISICNAQILCLLESSHYKC